MFYKSLFPPLPTQEGSLINVAQWIPFIWNKPLPHYFGYQILVFKFYFKCSLLPEYNINPQKSVVFLHANNEQSTKKTNNSTYKCIKRVKFLGINLTKDVKVLFIENYKTLLMETKNLNEWKNIWCSWTRRLNIVKMAIPPKDSK